MNVSPWRPAVQAEKREIEGPFHPSKQLSLVWSKEHMPPRITLFVHAPKEA